MTSFHSFHFEHKIRIESIFQTITSKTNMELGTALLNRAKPRSDYDSDQPWFRQGQIKYDIFLRSEPDQAPGWVRFFVYNFWIYQWVRFFGFQVTKSVPCLTRFFYGSQILTQTRSTHCGNAGQLVFTGSGWIHQETHDQSPCNLALILLSLC